LGRDEKDEGRDGVTIFYDHCRYPIPSLIFFVLTQLSILIQLSSNIVTPSLPSSFSSWGNDIRRQLNKYGELGRDEKDEERDGVTIFDHY
jgi:hypothetical protein